MICEIEFFTIVSIEFCLFQALGHKASPFKTIFVLQIAYEICYGNILQITIRAGCIVICEIEFFSAVSVEFCLFQALGHKASPFKTIFVLQIAYEICYGNILQITIRAGCIVICEIEFFTIVSIEFCLFQALGHKASPFETIIVLQIAYEICCRFIFIVFSVFSADFREICELFR